MSKCFANHLLAVTVLVDGPSAADEEGRVSLPSRHRYSKSLLKTFSSSTSRIRISPKVSNNFADSGANQFFVTSRKLETGPASLSPFSLRIFLLLR